MSTPFPGTEAGLDLATLDAITEAVESGAGLPEVVRAAARALDASLVLTDRAGQVLAVAARSPADERSVMAEAGDVDVVELRVADRVVGRLRMRPRGAPAGPALLRLVTTLVASEVERVRAPEQATREAIAAFLHGVLRRAFGTREEVVARGREVGLDLEEGACVLVARAHAHAATEDGWRQRVLATAERGARAAVPGAVAALTERAEAVGAEVAVLVPGADGEGARAAEGVLRELRAGLHGHSFALGRSRATGDALLLDRAGHEALLAANVAEGDEERPALAFEETGAYRLLLPAMSEDPAELQRFYAETVEPLVAYDEQYATDLVQTVEAFLDADGNVAGTAESSSRTATRSGTGSSACAS